MNSRQRVLMALEHRQPDRVPLDLGGTHVSSIHVKAYVNLCRYVGIDPEPIVFSDVYQQTVQPNEALLDFLKVDTRGLFPLCSHNWNVQGKDVGPYYEHIDEWSFVQHFPKQGGLYWSLVKSPIEGMVADPQMLKAYRWPVAEDKQRVQGLRSAALRYRQQGKIVLVKSLCAGLFEMGQRLRGMENFLCDLMADKPTAAYIMDNILELKKRYWQMVFEELGDVVDIAVETDDYGTQDSQLISQETYVEMIEPRLSELIGFMKKAFNAKKSYGEKGYVFFHSCGNVRPFLPSFIQMGIDIINPVHIAAKGMKPRGLKADFGDKITFWGGGVETQHILPYGTPRQVREDIKRNVEALKSGGGFVFATVHNIQADAPAENIMAMYDALREFGQYC